MKVWVKFRGGDLSAPPPFLQPVGFSYLCQAEVMGSGPTSASVWMLAERMRPPVSLSLVVEALWRLQLL